MSEDEAQDSVEIFAMLVTKREDNSFFAVLSEETLDGKILVENRSVDAVKQDDMSMRDHIIRLPLPTHKAACPPDPPTLCATIS